MMKERDMLQQELEQLQKQPEGGNTGVEIDSSASIETKITENNDAENDSQSANISSSDTISADSQHKPIYDLKEIISEVNHQIKSDIKKVANFILPEPLRRQIKPAFKTFITIAKDTGLSVYGLVKRHVMVFLDKGSKDNSESSRNLTTGPETESIA
mmetsp:Transcript_1146/g.2122  ORF Transcript_1146/g.2122 Transcript_1146/m.2122 type:complete len:157 (+) Transcript_1146:1-471(+)